MSSEIVTQCPDMSASSPFDPEHFINWWRRNGVGIRRIVDALAAYQDDLAGRVFKEAPDVAYALYNKWTDENGAAVLASVPGEYSADTQKLLKVLHTRVFAGNPPSSAGPARILVAGDVQSGKTAAYTELIKALLASRSCAGFPSRYIILILGGVHNKLRRQTQERLSAELAAHEADGVLTWLTSTESDLVAASALKAISGEGNESYVAVVKKETSRLKAAAEVFNSLPAGGDFAVVIIDDECDQITPDTRKKQKRNSHRVASLLWGKKTNTGAWSMPEKFRSSGLVYVGYTATPYSNVFLDADREMSMYPCTYMYVLSPGEGYMGYDHYWPATQAPQRTMDVFRARDGEIDERRRGPNKFKVAGTALEEALLWFLVAACIKRERLASGRIAAVDRHTSMLVHAHVKVADHVSMRDAVEKYTKDLADNWAGPDGITTLNRLLGAYNKAMSTESCPVSRCSESADEVAYLLRKHLTSVFENTRIVCDNSRSKERLSYPDDRDPSVREEVVEVIAVGGYTLSRGITLRGLVSSYVSRITKVVYDTFLQLCRWFGYRRGYEDLTRLWVSKTVSDTYAEIAAVDRAFKKAVTAAGIDPEGPYGHEQIYLGAVAGALPSSTLDSLIRSTAFKEENPYGNRLFGPAQAWTDESVGELLQMEECTGADVARFLEKYEGPDRQYITQIAKFIDENDNLRDCAWDVKRPIKDKDPAARFERGRKDGTTKLLESGVWFVKTPTVEPWRTVKDRPVLVVAPALIHPPAELPTDSPRPDWIVAAVFDKKYGPADSYMNESIPQLMDEQQEEFTPEDDKRGTE